MNTTEKLAAIRSNDRTIEKINQVLESLEDIDGADWTIAYNANYAAGQPKKENWFLESHKSFASEIELLLNCLEKDNKRMSLEIVRSN